MSEGRTAVRRLVAVGAAVVLLVMVGVAALLVAGAKALDDLQAREDRALVQSVLDRAELRVGTDIASAAVWDQAYRELQPGGHVAWADSEVGSYFANNRGHDWSIAVDGGNRPFYAWVGKHRSDPAGQRQLLADAAPVIRQARAREAAHLGQRPPALQPSDPSLSDTASGIVVSGGVPYLVAAGTVTPEVASAPRRPGPAVLLISGQRMDGALLTALRELNVKDARLETGRIRRSPTTIPVRDMNGRTIGQLAWTHDRAGLQILRAAAPVIALGLAIMAAVLVALAWQIRRVAQRLESHEQAHQRAMRDLEDARDRAESANVAKSQFLANMSHEIRTPLNGVLGMAQVLSKSNLAPADQEKLQVIRASGETLLSLLNDLLDLSKIEAGKMEIDVHDFDLETTVETATRAFGAIAAQKDVRFLVEIEPDAQGVWKGDAVRIRQVLSNFASNAVKFTTAGEVRVSVRRGAKAEGGRGIVCTVADSGAGIARDRLEELFKRFTQVDPSATRRFGGTGLGLAISRELVELMGGKVSVTSVEGRGSAFTFELPLEWVGPRQAASLEAEAEPELPPLRVLAAEDNKTNQLLLTAMLAPMGVDVRVTGDGAEALAVFTEERFDLVLMDIQMPVMNGVDATVAMRALEAREGRTPTPILALSANVMRHQIEEYLSVGMNGFVAKPIEMAALVGAMDDALAGGDADAESVAA